MFATTRLFQMSLVWILLQVALLQLLLALLKEANFDLIQTESTQIMPLLLQAGGGHVLLEELGVRLQALMMVQI